MSETLVNPIEQEIAALSREIEAKRKELDASRGVVREAQETKDVIHASLGEKIQKALPAVPLAPVPPQGTAVASVTGTASSGNSYLDDLDEETVAQVNALIQEVFAKGIDRAIKDAKTHDPYVIDAFHDALTDKMYEELKRRKAIKS